jgi:hypothetical protein
VPISEGGGQLITPVVLRGDDHGVADRLRADLGRRDGWSAPDPPLDLLARFARMLWGYESGDGTAGASSLADRETFLAAVRELRDRLIAAVAGPASSWLVDVVAEPDRLQSLHDLLWSDAITVSNEAGPEQVAEAATTLRRTEPPHGEVERLSDGRLIVVLGAARSGTTWLHRMLSAHPQIAGTPTGETWLFPDIAPIWNDLGGRLSEAELVAALRAFCDRLLERLRRRVDPAAGYVSEKTPAAVWRLPMLARLYPDAHYVHVIRDGRDAALSMTRAGAGRDDLRTAAEAWVAAVQEVRNGSGLLPSFWELRYEDLLLDHPREIARIWEWIGLPVTDAASARLAERGTERISPLPGEGPVGRGKWQALPDRDQAVLNEATDPLRTDLGYRDRIG